MPFLKNEISQVHHNFKLFYNFFIYCNFKRLCIFMLINSIIKSLKQIDIDWVTFGLNNTLWTSTIFVTNSQSDSFLTTFCPISLNPRKSIFPLALALKLNSAPCLKMSNNTDIETPVLHRENRCNWIIHLWNLIICEQIFYWVMQTWIPVMIEPTYITPILNG